MKVLGKIDKESILLAKNANVNLTGGYIRNTDNRVIIGNKLFLELGMKYRYVLRSRIVWWLHTGMFLRGCEDGNIHHINDDRLDDRFNNLEFMFHVEHSKHHNPRGLTNIHCRCKYCHNDFLLPRWRLKELGRGSYCSQNCYQTSRIQ